MTSDDSKPVIFVSHAGADSEIATQFKSDVETSFLGLCHLFVSSNLDSLGSGREWMQEIKHNLSVAKISIGLISPLALSRPWIYAEFGAGWIRDIPTISVCHSGIDRGQLPVPLSHFQALNLTDEHHLEHLYDQISKAIGCQRPIRDFNIDVENYVQITEVHRISRLIQHWISQLTVWNPEFTNIFSNERVEILVPSEADPAFRNFKLEAEKRRFLVIEPKGFSMGTRVGMQATNWEVQPGDNFDKLKELIGPIQHEPGAAT